MKCYLCGKEGAEFVQIPRWAGDKKSPKRPLCSSCQEHEKESLNRQIEYEKKNDPGEHEEETGGAE